MAAIVISYILIPLELYYTFGANIDFPLMDIFESIFIIILTLIGVVQEFGFFILLRKISKLFLGDAMSKSFAFSIAIKNTALTAGVAMLSSNEIALASSIVVLLHVPMFSWIMHKRDNI